MRTHLKFALPLILTASLRVVACPGCKEAIKGQGGFWASGFNWSIVFMLAVFFTLLATVCYKIYRLIQREQKATANDSESVHASKGYWMTITLPVCAIFIGILMTLGSVGAASKTQDAQYSTEQSVQTDLANAQGDILITFKSETCSICKQMKLTMDDIANAYQSKVKLVYVNSADSKALAEKFNVDDLPCSVFIRNGKETARRAGLCTGDEFKAWMDERLK